MEPSKPRFKRKRIQKEKVMAETQTFKEAYSVLQRHAETLRRQTEPGIDDLLLIVEESVVAYKVCKERIDAVEKALQKALVDVGDASMEPSAESPPRTVSDAQPSTTRRPASRTVDSLKEEPDENSPF
jgi:exodeoxyribonuclease VII small subunit